MKFLIDMNLSPEWVRFFSDAGYESIHWSAIGDARATDPTVMSWARAHGCIVFTHDLDFSTIIATAGLSGPSVLQVRTQDVMPEVLGPTVLQVLRDHAGPIERVAIVTIDAFTSRVRILPVRSASE